MAFEIVANLDDLEPGETLFVEGLREPICLVRLDDDDVRAVHNTCTHQQQPLHEGTVQDDDTLVCASHNSRFDLTTGESIGIPVVPPLPVYACRIEGDAILVDIDQQLNDAPIPHRRTTEQAGASPAHAHPAPVDHHGAVLLGRLEQRGVAAVLPPHRNRQRLTRQHRPAEPPGHGPEPGRVAVAQHLQQGPAGHPVGAQAVQDRLAEAAAGGELRVDVQRVAVAGQPVDQRLLRPGRLDDLVVGLPVRPFPRPRRCRARRRSRPRRG